MGALMLGKLEQRLLNNAKFKDWECTAELMATRGGNALYVHCLHRITGVSCKAGEVGIGL